MDIKIRKVLEKDRQAIISIINRNDNFTQEEKDCARELLEIYLTNPLQKDYDFFCAVDEDDKPVGYVCYGRVPLTDGTYDLYWIVVEPCFHGKGIGKTLVKHLENVLKKTDCRMLFTETSSKPDYAKTRFFYERNGFFETARLKDFYRSGDDKIIYCKNIIGDEDWN